MTENGLDITGSSSINLASFPIQNFNITFNPLSIIATQNRIKTIGWVVFIFLLFYNIVIFINLFYFSNICNSSCTESKFKYFLSKNLRKIDDFCSIDTSIAINIIHSGLSVCNGFFNKFYIPKYNIRATSSNRDIVSRTNHIFRTSYQTGISLISEWMLPYIYSSLEIILIAILKKSGNENIRLFRLSGVKISLFSEAGFTARELLKGGFSREDILSSGYQVHDFFW
jgi:hypothetical protein